MVALLSSSAYSVKSQVNSIAQAPMTHDEQLRAQEMRYAWKAYKGQLPDPLKTEVNQPNHNTKVNRCGPIVTKGASSLFGEVVKIEASDEAGSEGDGKVQAFIDGLWGDDDDKMTLLNKIAINGGCFGEPFLKLIPARGMRKYPKNVRIVTSPEDCDLHVAYIIETPGPGTFQKRQIISRVDPDNSAPTVGEEDMNDTWTISNYVRMNQGGSWYLSGAVDTWDYPFPPIFCCQNLPNPNEAWGTPDLTPDLIQMNEALNFLLSTLARIIYFHGHPKTWASGIYPSQLAVGVGDILCLPTDQSKLGKLDAMDNFTGILSIVDDLRSSMDEQSRIPAVALGRLKDIVKGQVSGITMKLMFQPLVEITTLKKRLYGKLIRDVTIAALIVSGTLPVEMYEDYQIALHFSDVLPVDDLIAAQTALLLQQVGVSTHTLLTDLDFDPEAEAAKSAKESQQKLTDYSQGQSLPPTDQPPSTPGGQMVEQDNQQQGIAA
jgi:hypothetical protein